MEELRLAVLRNKAPVSEENLATARRNWIVREGTMSALTDRLAAISSGHITIRHEPGASALNRLMAVADGINLELAKQRTIASPTITPLIRDIDHGDIKR